MSATQQEQNQIAIIRALKKKNLSKKSLECILIAALLHIYKNDLDKILSCIDNMTEGG